MEEKKKRKSTQQSLQAYKAMARFCAVATLGTNRAITL